MKGRESSDRDYGVCTILWEERACFYEQDTPNERDVRTLLCAV